MMEKNELATLLGSYGLGFLASFGVEAYVDKVKGLTIEQIGPFEKPSSWLDILAGIITGGLGYGGYVGKGPVTETLTQEALMGIGAGLGIGGILATLRPKVVPISDEAKAIVKGEVMAALRAAGATIPIEAEAAVAELGVTLAPPVAAFATPITAEESKFAEIYGY